MDSYLSDFGESIVSQQTFTTINRYRMAFGLKNNHGDPKILTPSDVQVQVMQGVTRLVLPRFITRWSTTQNSKKQIRIS